jgi:hypothetical protein
VYGTIVAGQLLRVLDAMFCVGTKSPLDDETRDKKNEKGRNHRQYIIMVKFEIYSEEEED